MFALADHLGKTVGEVLEITAQEFTYWKAYHRILRKRHDKGRNF